MRDDTEAFCEMWETLSYAFPSHSDLYHLDPIGLGTPVVECLTSYITRLAEAHSVHPRRLFTSILFPRLKLPYLYSAGRPVYDHLTTFWIQSPNLNGTGSLAQTLVQVLEQLTLHTHLHFLTMLPCKEVLATRKLLRRTRAWCSACYEEWREKQEPVYEPLLWMLNPIRIFPTHKQALQTRCPYQNCARTLTPLAPRAQPGYCPWCNRWLGYACAREHLLPDDTEMKYQQWIASTVGELLATAPSLVPPLSRDGFIATLNRCVAEAGNVFAATRRLHVAQKSLYQMLFEQQIPSLEIVLRMCTHLRISVFCFLTGNAFQPSTSQAAITPNTMGSAQPKRKFRQHDAEKLQRELETISQASEEPPPSMRAVERRLGIAATYLEKRFPEPCRMISQRYLAYRSEHKRLRLQVLEAQVREAAIALHAQGKYPSSIRVSKILGTYGVFKEKRAYEIWQKTLRELGLKP